MTLFITSMLLQVVMMGHSRALMNLKSCRGYTLNQQRQMLLSNTLPHIFASLDWEEPEVVDFEFEGEILSREYLKQDSPGMWSQRIQVHFPEHPNWPEARGLVLMTRDYTLYIKDFQRD